MDQAVKEFSEVAKAYCQWVEGDAKSEDEEIKTAIHLLANLYTKALLLPNNCGEADANSISEDELREMIRPRFSDFPFGFYNIFFTPYDFELEDDACVGDLIDDLGDIYRDVKEGLDLFDRGEIDSAIWEWRFNFTSHWGRHATEALNVLHIYIDNRGCPYPI